ncbi:hypothetical protein C0039_10825 [Pseudohalioglobus lutimaris]|uniref:Type II secretion system protein GspG C-terminal domain-containing protein n=2 Tax=Pseudohalioglobus lutimaris TaxID=1737061 RepID=A0A2N5X2W1_9GAMM|nr:hypothetical protein C0039_10825 [Pseudohalioglobus lutimaris]
MLAACSSDISLAKQAVEDSLTITTDLEFQELDAYPGNVVCGSFSAYVSYSEPRQLNQPFIVANGALNKRPSEDDWQFYCNDDQASALYAVTGIGPFTADSTELIKITADFALIADALEAYYRDNYYYPSAEQGLQALVEKPTSGRQLGSYRDGGYLDAVPTDPWGHAYRYEEEQWGRTKGSFVLKTLGLSAQPGGDGANADISSRVLPYLQHLARMQGVD